MTKKDSTKNVQGDGLHVFLVDLRDFMLGRDKDTLCTERELAARIVNGLIISLTLRDENDHTHIALLGLREDGVSHEGCQDDLVSTAAVYLRNVKGSNIREFSSKDGLVKMDFPFWLQAPFGDGKVLTSASSREPLSECDVLYEIISKWQYHPIDLILVTKKDSAPDLDVFKKFASWLKENGFPQLVWGIVDISDWRMFDPIVHFIPLEKAPAAKKKMESNNEGSLAT